MTTSVNFTAEDRSGRDALAPHVDGTVNGRGLHRVKHLPEEYYERLLSQTAKDLKLPPIRALFALEDTPGVLSLMAGKPDENAFPFTSISFTAISPTDPSKETTATLDSAVLKEALQYGPTEGLPKVKEWIVRFQEYMHKRKRDEGWAVTMGVGSQDLTFKAIKSLVNLGDSILIESPGYAGLIPAFASLHCEQIEVNTDSKGVNSTSLRKILENWAIGKPKPKLLYTVPYGGNPAGMTTSIERRREILTLAREHDFIILEDDPYYWLYYGDDERPPSYFQLEQELPEVGRVLRFDSFSKVLGGGIRFGWASGPKILIDTINVQTASSNLQPSSLAQVMTLALVEPWGHDGFETFARNVSNMYRTRRDAFDKALQEHLGDLAEWSTPESGLFFWVKLHLDPYGGEGDSEELILTKAFQNGVLALPGTFSFANRKKSAYVRLSFSLLPEDLMHEAVKRLRAVIVKEREVAVKARQV